MKAFSLPASLRSPYEWKASLLVLAGSLVLPFLVHLIPYQGPAPIGARLLPIFIFPLLGVRWFRWQVGLLAVFAPILSYLFTGQPQGALLIGLSLHLLLFVAATTLLQRSSALVWVVGPAAYVLALILSRSLLQLLTPSLAFPMDVSTTLLMAWPGLLILGIISLLLRAQVGSAARK